MNTLVCKRCHHIYHVGGEPDEVKSLLKQAEYPCITVGCAGVLVSDYCVPLRGGYHVVHVPLHGFFRAVHGFGPVKGTPAALADVELLFRSDKIERVVAFSIGDPERVILKELVFESGTRMHFDSSSRGACIYYVEKPGPSCTEEVEDVLRAEGDAGRSESHREET